MREAKSYSIVDHVLLHGGYLARISHRALALYLFLAVVGDRDGRSFYSDPSIGNILRLSLPELLAARTELIVAGLVEYRAPNWRVKSLSRRSAAGVSSPPGLRPSRHDGLQQTLREPVPVRGIIPEALKAIIRSSEKRT
jgi:hypothetical protein